MSATIINLSERRAARRRTSHGLLWPAIWCVLFWVAVAWIAAPLL